MAITVVGFREAIVIQWEFCGFKGFKMGNSRLILAGDHRLKPAWDLIGDLNFDLRRYFMGCFTNTFFK